MQLLKRKILLEEYVDRNYNSPTYGVLTATTFYLKVIINQKIDDMGIMTDTPFESGLNSPLVTDFYDFGRRSITGVTDSKLSDVRSYNKINPYQIGLNTSTETYINFSGQTIQGVNKVSGVVPNISYSLDVDKNDVGVGTINQKDGLFYKEQPNSNISNVIYHGEGWNETNTSYSALTKEEYLFGIIYSPEVKSDVFIDRGVTPVMEKHLKLSEIRNLNQLERYGNGFYQVIKQ